MNSDEAPFGLYDLASDFVVELRPVNSGAPASRTEVVTRHGDWVRIDKTRSGRQGAHFVSLSRQGGAFLSRDASDRYQHLVLSTREEEDREREPRPTERVETVLGEPCRVWDAFRWRNKETGTVSLRRLSWVSSDGIELARALEKPGQTASPEEQAVRVERRPVSLNDTQPPPNLLDLGAWAVELGGDPERLVDGHELVRESQRGMEPVGREVERRHGQWTAVLGSGRPYSLSGPNLFMGIDRLEGQAATDLFITRDLDPLPQPEPAQSSDRVLGEVCNWFDATPGYDDVGTMICLTDDGVRLKIEHTSQGNVYKTWVATRLDRRPVALKEVLPPFELADPAKWPLPAP